MSRVIRLENINGLVSNDDRKIKLDLQSIVFGVITVQVLLALSVISETAGLSVPLVREVLTIVYLTIVPGLLLSLLLRLENRPLPTLISYIVGLSFVGVMAVGGVISIAFPAVGITNPISTVPLLMTFLVLTSTLLFVTHSRRREVSVTLPVGEYLAPLPLALSLLPPISILGTALYQTQGTNIVLIAMLIAIAILPVLVAMKRIQIKTRWLALATWTIGLALLYHGDLWPILDSHQASTLTMTRGRWVPSEQTLLQNSILFPVYALIAGISMPVQWEIVNTFFVSFLPVALFESFRRYLSSSRAFVVVCFFMFSFPFYVLYPGAGRAATPVLFLALLALALADRSLPAFARSSLALSFAGGLAVSHYGTSYVALLAFLVAIVVFSGLKVLEGMKVERPFRDISKSGDSTKQQNPLNERLLSPSFLFFYFVSVVSWYLYTLGGTKYEIFVRKVVAGVNGVLYGELSGSAAGAVSRDYIGFSITVSKYLYIIIGMLMGVGFASTIARRLFNGTKKVPDEYLAVAIGFMSMLGASFLPAGAGFNVARVMMITFTFTAPFVLFGVDTVVDAIVSTGTKIKQDVGKIGRSQLTIVFSVLLLVFCLINTGVVAALITQDLAPSNTINSEQLLESKEPSFRIRATECVECNIETHSWIMNNAEGNTPTADRLGTVQVDFYRGPLTERVAFVPSNSFYKPMSTVNNNTSNGVYLVLLPHNTDTNGFTTGYKYNWEPYGNLNYKFSKSDLIYDTGESKIQLSRGPSQITFSTNNESSTK